MIKNFFVSTCEGLRVIREIKRDRNGHQYGKLGLPTEAEELACRLSGEAGVHFAAQSATRVYLSDLVSWDARSR